jgi:hypothetical protein
MTPAEYVTREELQATLRELVASFDRRTDRLEHAVNRTTIVFGLAFFLVFAVELFILYRLGLT